MNWYLTAFKQYATFSGRATRSEYWYFVLFYTLMIIVATVIDTAMGEGGTNGMLMIIVVLVHLIPTIAVSVRRLHDIGKSGWWYLLSLIPIIGPLVLLFFAVLDSDEDNAFGPNPKAI